MIQINKKESKAIKTDKLVQWLVTYKFISTTFIAILIFTINYLLFFKETKAQYEMLIEQEIRLKESFEKKQVIAATIDDYNKKKEIFNKEFNKVLKLFPKKKNVSALTENIFKLARANKLAVNFFAPMHEVKREFYVELPIQLAVTGQYEQLATFLSRVEYLPYLITFGDFKVSKIVSKSAKDLSNKLLMKVTFKVITHL
ncbi:type IV pilus inner membrane component PilO [Legionella hackeliae]|uniref:Pilus assembly protein PilO n=1 Tax=Legionella hackeliae TaxID=449 RepID=A0A0A8UVU3_LEGHA|nr:type 4a pilus biogenesis protein PilO [Legionella hackeliae]KTD15438.1 type IV pilus biogenesis protein PilO [Legionella hackeliae]CEK11192.1 protein of unknown function [Legionella hackeliae]STX47957.1 type IV pilus biogenesis protein PilO [Legionella hackeliae]